MVADCYMYEPLDFSSIMGEKFAVHCQTEEDARHFCAEIKRQFGKEFIPDRPDELVTHWCVHGDQTAYSPKLSHDNWPMTYCYIDWYAAKDYDIVPFDDLRVIPEFGEIMDEGIDINTLFG